MRAFVLPLVAAAVVATMPPAEAHIPHDEVASLALSPSYAQDSTLYAVIRDGLFRSVDGGERWDRVTRGLCIHRLTTVATSAAFDEPDVWVGCKRGHVHRSADAGRRWRSAQLAPSAPVVAIAPVAGAAGDPVILALDAEGRLQRSTDGGVHFDVADVRGVASFAEALGGVVAGTRSGTLLYSADGAESWSSVARLPRAPAIVSVLAPASAQAETVLYVGTAGAGLFRLEHESGAFAVAGRSLPGSHVGSIARLATGRGTVLLATTATAAVFRSIDDGATWTLASAGLRVNAQAAARGRTDFGNVVAANGVAFAATYCGVFRSDDGGRRWRLLETTLHHPTGLAVAPVGDGGRFLAIGTYGGGALVSRDDGAHWTPSNLGLSNPRLGTIELSPAFATDRTLFAAHYFAILRSTDAGERWRAATIDPPPLRTYGARLRRRVQTFAARVRPLAELLASESLRRGAKTHTVYPLDIAVSPAFASDGTVFAGMRPYGIVRSVDGGATFEWIWDGEGGSVDGVVLSPQFARDKTVFAGHRGGVSRSTDGGTTWRRLANLGLASTRLAISPDFAVDGTVWAGGQHGLFRTRDGGMRWTSVAGVTGPVAGIAVSPDFAFDRELLVQLRGGALLRVRDDVAEVEVAALDAPGELGHFILKDTAPLIRYSPGYRTDRTIYAVAWQDVVRSTDGGESWMSLDRPRRYEVDAGLDDFFELPTALEGRWDVARDEAYSAGRALRSAGTASGLTFGFVGTGVHWIGSRGPRLGRAEVWIDGKLQGVVSQAAARREHGAVIFGVAGLPRGPHEIVIRSLSQEPVEIDALDVERQGAHDHD